MTIPTSAQPTSPQSDRQAVVALLDRVTSLASLLYTVQISLDSLVLDDDPTTHDHERADHAKDTLAAALVQTRALGVAIGD